MRRRSLQLIRDIECCPGRARIGIAADHGGYELKSHLTAALEIAGCEIVDFGAVVPDPLDDYPDFVIPLSRAVARGEVFRGVAICGSGVGACMASNKVAGARAALVTNCFSAHQGVEDDDINVMCLGALVTGPGLAWDLVKLFLGARFKGEERFLRRLGKVAALEGTLAITHPRHHPVATHNTPSPGARGSMSVPWASFGFSSDTLELP